MEPLFPEPPSSWAPAGEGLGLILSWAAPFVAEASREAARQKRPKLSMRSFDFRPLC
jgi:hypothetical protein